MEFRDYIYLDTNALNQYCEQLGTEKKVEKEVTNKSKKEAKAGGGIPFLKAEGGAETEKTESFTQKNSETDLLLTFEKEARNKNALLDFKEDITSIRRGSMNSFDVEIQIPKGFQILDPLKRFLPQITSSLTPNPKDRASIELAKSLLTSYEFERIPFFSEREGGNIYGKLKLDFFLPGYSWMDLHDETVTVIAKVDKIHLDEGTTVEVFNLQQSLLNVPQMLLQNTKTTDDENQIATVNTPAIKISVLAIFKWRGEYLKNEASRGQGAVKLAKM